MTGEETWKLITTFLGIIGITGGFLYWHFKTVNAFKDDIHRLELKYKDLEQSDQLQQQSIDRLKEIAVWIDTIFKK